MNLADAVSELRTYAKEVPDLPLTDCILVVLAELDRRMAKDKKPVRKPGEPKPRNILLDTLAIIEGQQVQQVSPMAWARLAKALQAIKAVMPDVSPTEIERRARIYRANWPDRELTANALASWWGACSRPKVNGAVAVRLGDNRR